MIRFENVHKRYGQVYALRGIDISVREGEFAVLIGPSGCGKTTALKMVNRLVTPTQGRVLVGGQDVSQLNVVELRRNIGYVIQETGLFPHMTIADNIALVPRLKKWPKARREARVDELLDLVGLDPAKYRNRYPRQLSGGERQRVGVARALASDPPIILMDEPFGATDPITRKQLQKELVRIKEQVRKTVVFVTHDISEAFLLGDTICLLRAGEVVQHATPEEMLRRPADAFVEEFIGDEAILRQFEYLEMGEIARTPLPAVAAHVNIEQVRQLFLREGADAAAVVNEDGRFVGIITRKDAAKAEARAKVQDLAVPVSQTARASELVRDCFPRLTSSRNGRSSAAHDLGLVIVDDADRPQGLVTYGDIVQLVAGLVSGTAVDTGEKSDGVREGQGPSEGTHAAEYGGKGAAFR